MTGIYVKDMKMPKRCVDCTLEQEGGWCGANLKIKDVHEGHDVMERHPDCPLVPVSGMCPVILCRDCYWYYKSQDGYEMCDNSEGLDFITADSFCSFAKPKHGAENKEART